MAQVPETVVVGLMSIVAQLGAPPFIDSSES